LAFHDILYHIHFYYDHVRDLIRDHVLYDRDPFRDGHDRDHIYYRDFYVHDLIRDRVLYDRDPFRDDYDRDHIYYRDFYIHFYTHNGDFHHQLMAHASYFSSKLKK